MKKEWLIINIVVGLCLLFIAVTLRPSSGQWEDSLLDLNQWNNQPNMYQWSTLSSINQWDNQLSMNQWNVSTSINQWNNFPRINQWGTFPYVNQWYNQSSLSQWNTFSSINQWSSFPRVNQWNNFLSMNQWKPVPDINQWYLRPGVGTGCLTPEECRNWGGYPIGDPGGGSTYKEGCPKDQKFLGCLNFGVEGGICCEGSPPWAED